MYSYFFFGLLFLRNELSGVKAGHDNIDARTEQLYDVGGNENVSSPQESVCRMPPFKLMYILLLIYII